MLMELCGFPFVAESVRELLVQALIHILHQSNVKGSCKLVTLKDKSLNQSLLSKREQTTSHTSKVEAVYPQNLSTTTGLPVDRSALAADSQGHLQRHEYGKGNLKPQEESKEEYPTKMTQLQQDASQFSVLSEDRMASLMRQAVDGASRARGGGTAQPGGKITLDILSSALGSVSSSLSSPWQDKSERGSPSLLHHHSQQQPLFTQTDFIPNQGKPSSLVTPLSTVLSPQQRSSFPECVQSTGTPPISVTQQRENSSRKPFSDLTTTFRLNIRSALRLNRQITSTVVREFFVLKSS